MNKGKKKKIIILAGLGWSIRNVVFNEGFRKFFDENEVHYWTPSYSQIKDKLSEINFIRFDSLIYKNFSGIKLKKAQLVRYIYTYKHPSQRRTEKLKHERIKTKENGLISYFYFMSILLAAKIMSKFISDAAITNWDRKIGTISDSVLNIYYDRIKKIKPDLIVSTCPQINYSEWPPLIAAKNSGVETAAIILSWDNLTTKGSFPVEFDTYMVWSESMKDELKKEYNIDDNKINVTGAINFDSYHQNKYFESKPDFINRYNFKENSKILLYGSVTPALMPNDPEVCKILARAAAEKKLICDVNILVRLHPKDNMVRWKKLSEEFPEIKFSIPNPMGDLSSWLPDDNIILDQVSCVKYSDININVCSTLTIDSCIVNRPVVNVAFDPVDKEFSQIVFNYYNTDHYKIVVDTGGVSLAENAAQLIDMTNAYLSDPGKDSEARKKITTLQTEFTDGKNSERIVKCIEKILHQDNK